MILILINCKCLYSTW